MDKIAARTLAESMMAEHGLAAEGWTFRFDSAQRRLGACHHQSQHISMSINYVLAADEDDVRQTMLHEIAHALLPYRDAAGKRIGHGPVWKAKAASIGYTGARTAVNPHTRQVAEVRVAAANAPTLDRRPMKGDVVILTGGQNYLIGQLAVVNDRLQTRFSITIANGKGFRAPASVLRVVDPTSDAAKEFLAKVRPAAAAAPVREPRPGSAFDPSKRYARHEEGDTITFPYPKISRLPVQGQIVKVGRTRYHVTIPGQSSITTVPFELAA